MGAGGEAVSYQILPMYESEHVRWIFDNALLQNWLAFGNGVLAVIMVVMLAIGGVLLVAVPRAARTPVVIVVAIVAVIGAAFWTYRQNYETQISLREAERLRGEIAALREEGVL